MSTSVLDDKFTAIIFVLISLLLGILPFFPVFDILYTPSPEFVETMKWFFAIIVIIVGSGLIIGATYLAILFVAWVFADDNFGNLVMIFVGLVGLAGLGGFITSVLNDTSIYYNFSYELITLLVNPAYAYANGFLFNDLLYDPDLIAELAILAVYLIASVIFSLGMFSIASYGVMNFHSTVDNTFSLKKRFSIGNLILLTFVLTLVSVEAGNFLFELDFQPILLLKEYLYHQFYNLLSGFDLQELIVYLKNSFIWHVINERLVLVIVFIARAISRYLIIFEGIQNMGEEFGDFLALIGGVFLFIFATMNEIMILIFSFLTLLGFSFGILRILFDFFTRGESKRSKIVVDGISFSLDD